MDRFFYAIAIQIVISNTFSLVLTMLLSNVVFSMYEFFLFSLRYQAETQS